MTEEQRNILRERFDKDFAESTANIDDAFVKEFVTVNNESMFRMMLLGAMFAMEHFNDKLNWHPVSELPERPNNLTRFSNRVLTYDIDGDHDICIYNFEDKEWRNTDGYIMEMIEYWTELPIPKNNG